MRIKTFLLCLILVSGSALADKPAELMSRAQMSAAVQMHPELSAQEILEKAHRVAGGQHWAKPSQLKLTGYNIIRNNDHETVWDRYVLRRQYVHSDNADNQSASKVRIEGWSGDQMTMLLAYDGKQAYNRYGPLPVQTSNEIWHNHYGFGAIRNALGANWQHTRLADDLVDGAPAYMIALTSPSGGKTLFGIRQSDFAIVYAGFDTNRGWHERRYSHFFRKPNINWNQPGRVRLFYNGVKVGETVWLDFELQGDWPDKLFQIKSASAQ